MIPTKLIATYARVSTARQEEEQTIKTQILVLKEFAEKNGHTIVKEYADEGWSGDILARPSLDELRNDVKKKIWQAVLIYDPDRLAGRYSYQELVMDELREAGVEVIFITVSAPKNSEDKILHGVRGLFAEYERAKIAERFRLGKLRKVKDGHMLVGEAPYGYRYIRIQDGNPGYYEINDEEANVVRTLFNWVAVEGLTLRKMVMRLFELGVKPRRNKQGVWDKSTLSRILRNTAYEGEAMWATSVSVVPEKPHNIDKYKKMKKSSRRSRPKSEWIMVPVPAIIEKELFQKVSDKLKDNFAFSNRNKKYDYLLSGKIFCSCGKRRAGTGHRERGTLYYRCTDRLSRYPLPPTCKMQGLNVLIFDQIVWNKIVELMSSPDLITEQVNRLVCNGTMKPKMSLLDIVPLEKEVEKLRQQEERYNKAYGAGVFTLEKLKEYTHPIHESIVQIQTQISKNRDEIDHAIIALPKANEIEEFAAKAIKTLKGLNFQGRRAIVLNVVEKIVATKEKVLVR